MRHILIPAALLLTLPALAWAQMQPVPVQAEPLLTAPGAAPVESGGTPQTPLPTPDVAENAGVTEILQAALRAIVAGRIGEGQNALEMAQTRLLDRSVPLFQTNNPSSDPLVMDIVQARGALDAGDRLNSVNVIQKALAEAKSRGL